MGFIMHFYIIFGTNLLTEGPVPVAFFAYFSVSQKRNIKRNPNGMKPSREFFWTKCNPGDLEQRSRKRRGGHEVGGRAQGGRRAPHPHGPLVAPPTYFFRLYILLYTENIQGSHETTFPLPQPSVPVRSHLGTFSGDLPEGELITEGFYINIIASPMKREQFTSDLWVHSQQLDGFLSLFESQYKVLLDVLGDLFDVILFCGVFAEIR